MAKYIMALDAGTTSNRCILFNESGEMCSVSQREFPQYFPKPGWVEHDANEIWATQLGVAVEAMQKIGATAADIAAIGITNQRETTIVWDKVTGEPVHHAIVWQCRRTSEYCDELQGQGPDRFASASKTGLVIDAYFSGTKVHWLLENVPGARERAERGELLFGTVETWLIWKLTGGKVHVTDYSNASRTMLFNINTLAVGRGNSGRAGHSRAPCCRSPCPPAAFSARPTRRSSAAPSRSPARPGDQQAALFGQTCFQPGEAKNTYGTGCFLLMNTGEKPVFSQERSGHHDRLGPEREGRIRARRLRLRCRRRHPVAARRAEDHRVRAGFGILCRQGQGYQRLLRRPGVHGPRRAALGSVRARHHRGHHPRRQQESHHPRDDGIPGLSGQRHPRRHAGGLRHQAGRR